MGIHSSSFSLSEMYQQALCNVGLNSSKKIYGVSFDRHCLVAVIEISETCMTWNLDTVELLLL